MNSQDKLLGEIDDPMLAGALKHFKASVDAWSDTAYSRPRKVAVMPARFAAANWRLAASLALGCVLAASSLAGGVMEHHHRQELARIAAKQAAQKAAQERAEAEKSATEDKDLLATVESDVSQDVPAAMEPLAQLMDDNGTR